MSETVARGVERLLNSLSNERVGRIREIRENIPPNILIQLWDLHNRGWYIGTHGGGLTHSLRKGDHPSDIDIVVVPPSADNLSHPSLKRLTQTTLETRDDIGDVDTAVNLAFEEIQKEGVDYLSIKTSPEGQNNHPVGIHVEDPRFRQKNSGFGTEIRIPPKKNGKSEYMVIGVDRNGEDIIPFKITAPSKEFPDNEFAVINYTHQTGIVEIGDSSVCLERNTDGECIVRTEKPDTLSDVKKNVFVIGLEAGKTSSEYPLFFEQIIKDGDRFNRYLNHLYPITYSVISLMEWICGEEGFNIDHIHQAFDLFIKLRQRLHVERDKGDISLEEVEGALPLNRETLVNRVEWVLNHRL